MTYLITFEFADPNTDCGNVYKRIKDISEAWCPVCKNSWVIKTPIKFIDELFSALMPFFSDKDKLFIIEVKDNRRGLLMPADWEIVDSAIF